MSPYCVLLNNTKQFFCEKDGTNQPKLAWTVKISHCVFSVRFFFKFRTTMKLRTLKPSSNPVRHKICHMASSIKLNTHPQQESPVHLLRHTLRISNDYIAGQIAIAHLDG